MMRLQRWCPPKEHYLESIRKAGFQNVRGSSEHLYMDGEKIDYRKITSIAIKALKADSQKMQLIQSAAAVKIK